MGLSYTEVARILDIDQSTVKRVVKLFNNTGTVTKKVVTNPICPKVVHFCSTVEPDDIIALSPGSSQPFF